MALDDIFQSKPSLLSLPLAEVVLPSGAHSTMTRSRLSKESEVRGQYINRLLPEESACQILLRQMFAQMFSVWHIDVALSFTFGTRKTVAKIMLFTYYSHYEERNYVHEHVFHYF